MILFGVGVLVGVLLMAGPACWLLWRLIRADLAAIPRPVVRPNLDRTAGDLEREVALLRGLPQIEIRLAKGDA